MVGSLSPNSYCHCLHTIYKGNVLPWTLEPCTSSCFKAWQRIKKTLDRWGLQSRIRTCDLVKPSYHPLTPHLPAPLSLEFLRANARGRAWRKSCVAQWTGSFWNIAFGVATWIDDTPPFDFGYLFPPFWLNKYEYTSKHKLKRLISQFFTEKYQFAIKKLTNLLLFFCVSNSV